MMIDDQMDPRSETCRCIVMCTLAACAAVANDLIHAAMACLDCLLAAGCHADTHVRPRCHDNCCPS